MSRALAPERVRLDRWLWAARLFKTRAQAKAAIEGGKVQLDGARPKVAKEIEPGVELRVRRGDEERTLVVLALSEVRRGAPEAALLYRETDASIEKREAAKALRQMERAGLRVPQRRPNKQDRRALDALKRGQSASSSEVRDER